MRKRLAGASDDAHLGFLLDMERNQINVRVSKALIEAVDAERIAIANKTQAILSRSDLVKRALQIYLMRFDDIKNETDPSWRIEVREWLDELNSRFEELEKNPRKR